MVSKAKTLYVVVSSNLEPEDTANMPWIVANELAAYTKREDAEKCAAQDEAWSVEEWPAEKVKMAIDITYFKS